MNTAEWAKGGDAAGSKMSHERYTELMDRGAAFVRDEQFAAAVVTLADEKERVVMGGGLLMRTMATLGAALGIEHMMHILSATNGTILNQMLRDGDLKIESVTVQKVEDAKAEDHATSETVH